MSASDLHQELPKDSELPNTFGGVWKVLDRLVPDGSGEEYAGSELLDPTMEATFRRFIVTPALAQRVGLGDTVRCHIMLDGSKGAVVVMRSRNLFNTRRFGFCIQPKPNDTDNSEGDYWNSNYEVWQAPVRAFSPARRHWGIDKLKVEDAWLSSPRVANALIKSLLINDQDRKVT